MLYRKEGIMPILTDEEADALDELLTKTTPKLNPDVQGPFIRHREMAPGQALVSQKTQQA
jgi:hypothetical protein